MAQLHVGPSKGKVTVRRVVVPTQPLATPPPSGRRPSGTSSGNNPPGFVWKLVGAVAVVLLAIAGGVWLVQNVYSEGSGWQPNIEEKVYVHDVATGRIDPVPSADEVFSGTNLQRYEAGDGFRAILRTTNYSQNDYAPVEKVCGVEPWAEFQKTADGVTQSPYQRELYVEGQRLAYNQCIDGFDRPISDKQEIVIALDDTEGVGGQYAERVRMQLDDEFRRLPHQLHNTQIYCFRLTDASYRDYRRVEIPAGASESAVQREWSECVDWLLQARGGKSRSSIAYGLFNALSMNRDVRNRRIYVFTDGMENSSRTNFYQAARDRQFLARSNWEKRDAEIETPSMKCPSLEFAAKVQMNMPLITGDHFEDVRTYWQHVFTDVCRAPANVVEVNY